MINLDKMIDNLDKVKILDDDDIMTRKLLNICAVDAYAGKFEIRKYFKLLNKITAKHFIEAKKAIKDSRDYKNSELVDMCLCEYLVDAIRFIPEDDEEDIYV